METELCQSAVSFIDQFSEVLVHSDVCLLISQDVNSTWYEASNKCRAFGASLAYIDSESIQDRIIFAGPGMETGTEGYWIGLTRVKWIWQLSEYS